MFNKIFDKYDNFLMKLPAEAALTINLFTMVFFSTIFLVIFMKIFDL